MHKSSIFLLLAALVSAAGAQSGSFIISQRGHSVGTASFRVAANSQGLDSTSAVRLKMQGLEYTLSKTEQLSAAHGLRKAELNAAVNGSTVKLTAAAEQAGVQLAISADGKDSANQLPGHANAVLLPDFDPGALETLLALAAQQNGRDLWAVVPKQAGSVVPILLATYADEQGDFNGRPIVVHHLVANIGGTVTDLFSGPENQLLQAELPQPGFALVRRGFVLTPSTRPGAAPSER